VADGKAMRSMRVDVALWDASMAKAKAEGRTLTDVVEALLARWVTTPQGDADGADQTRPNTVTPPRAWASTASPRARELNALAVSPRL
jgi:hypothetical protein